MTTDRPDRAISRAIRIQVVDFPEPPFGLQNESVGIELCLVSNVLSLNPLWQTKVSQEFISNAFHWKGGRVTLEKANQGLEFQGFPRSGLPSLALARLSYSALANVKDGPFP